MARIARSRNATTLVRPPQVGLAARVDLNQAGMALVSLFVSRNPTEMDAQIARRVVESFLSTKEGGQGD